MSKNKHKGIDFIRISVEEKVGRKLGNTEYKAALNKSYKKDCCNMASRINEIVRNI